MKLHRLYTLFLLAVTALTATAQIGGFDPENPGDPQGDDPSHTLKVVCSPAKVGYFTINEIVLSEGEQCDIVAYVNYDQPYSFERWTVDGKELSRDHHLTFTMPSHDVTLVGEFVYDPQNPTDPSNTLWNPETGELFISCCKPGSFYSTIQNTVGKDHLYQVRSIVVEGEMANGDVFNICNLPLCRHLDMSRTMGVTAILSSDFYDCNLSSLVLPATIEELGPGAFNNCHFLNEVTCWAMTPPAVTTSTFYNASDSIIFYVPTTAMGEYLKTDVWRDMKLKPIKEVSHSLTIRLPDNVPPVTYAQMNLQVTNTQNAQQQRYVMGNERSYVFHGIPENTSWNVAILNGDGNMFGSINGVNVEQSDVTVTFANLLTPQTVRMTVQTPEGKNVTNQTEITWTDDQGNYIAHTSEVKNRPPGQRLTYSVSLLETLLMSYGDASVGTCTVTDGDNSVTVTLTPHAKESVLGRVTDADSGNAIFGATVAVGQTYRDGVTKSILTYTDKEGKFAVETDDVRKEVTISLPGFLTRSVSVGQGNQDLGDVALTPVTGATIEVSATFTHCPDEDGLVKIDEGYADMANVDYTVYNVSTGQELTDIILQGQSIIIPKGADPGQSVRITASSLNGGFMSTSSSAVIDENQTATVNLSLIELGRMEAHFKSSLNSANVGVLYDEEGNLLKAADYEDSTLSLNSLPDGEYTLLTMGKCDFYNNVDQLSGLSRTTLQEGTDYLLSNLEMKSGAVTMVDVGDVPFLDETKLYYTSVDKTRFVAAKSRISVGEFQTLKAGMVFRGEYSENVRDVRIVVDLPSGCQLVENSLVNAGRLVPYSRDGNEISFEASGGYSSGEWRFCIIPLEGGDVNITGFVEFSFEGSKIRQPLGHARFQAENLKMVAPRSCSSDMVSLTGYAQNGSEVKIFDNGQLIGTATATVDGVWMTNCQLYKAYPFSVHELQAQVLTTDGLTLKSEVKRVTHNINLPHPEKVVMYYDNKYMKKTYVVTYDMMSATKTPPQYYFYPNSKDFTFTVDFSRNDTSVVKNVVLYVKCQNGSIHPLHPHYDDLSGRWIAEMSFGNGGSGNFPVNVALDYSVYDDTPVDYSLPVKDDEEVMEMISAEIENAVDQSLSGSVLEDTSEQLSLLCQISGQDSDPYHFTLTKLDYDETVALMSKQQFLFAQSGEGFCCIYPQVTDDLYEAICIDTEEHQAFSVALSMVLPSTVKQVKGKQQKPYWLAGLTFAAREIYYLRNRFRFMNVFVDHMNEHASEIDKFDNSFMSFMKSDCGKMMTDVDKKYLYTWRNRIMSQALEDYDKMVEGAHFYNKALIFREISAFTFAVLGKITGDHMAKGVEFFDKSFMDKCASISKRFSGKMSDILKWYMKSYSATVLGLVPDDIILPSLGADIPKWEEDFSKNEAEVYKNIISQLKRFDEEIESTVRLNGNMSPDCWKRKYPLPDPEPDFLYEDAEVAIDPSGFVYEAVPSNRVEGVTATIFYKKVTEDMYGDKHEEAVKWNASEFDQKNPLFTDAMGMYRWDVPQGLWQVRFEKDGYETTTTEWLPVPPPQLDINVAVTQCQPADVRTVHAYEDAVDLEFSKHMMPELLDSTNIQVLVDDKAVEGAILFTDLESDSIGGAGSFARRVRFEPAAPFDADEITLWVSNRLKTYAGVRMQEDFRQSFRVEKAVSSIVCDSLRVIPYGEEDLMEVFVFPKEASAGKTLLVIPSSEDMLQTDAREVVINETGQATVRLRGLLPGTCSVRFVLEEYALEAVTAVRISQSEYALTASPITSLPSGSVVSSGTEVYLYCSTPDATIYYTTDGSCPCETNSTRKVYDGTPLIINENTVVKAMAVAPGRLESEVATFVYQVTGEGISSITTTQMHVYPLPAREQVHVEAGGQRIEHVTISTIDGKIATSLSAYDSSVTVDVASLPTGVYILEAITNNGRLRRKIVKW